MKLDIIKNQKIFLGISIFVIAIAVFSMAFKNLNYGIDFTGGSLFQLKFENNVELEDLNGVLDEISKEYNEVGYRKVQISEGNTAFIRTAPMSEESKKGMLLEIENQYNKFEIMKSEKVGATIGKELKWKAINALLIAGLLIVLYITFRFELKFAIAALIALFHDVIIAVGLIALIGLEVNTPFIAAVLTILGYSINDTIVVFDRIRENVKNKPESSLKDVINYSIGQVFQRSINTSVTTLLAIIALLIFGGATIQTIVMTLLIGVLAGTYSSIFVASPAIYILEHHGRDKIKQ
ncbi:MAG: protein translocase subunit SecF [Fusobacteriota bacterium]